MNRTLLWNIIQVVAILIAIGVTAFCAMGCHVHLHYHVPPRQTDALTQSLENMTNDLETNRKEDNVGWPDLDS